MVLDDIWPIIFHVVLHMVLLPQAPHVDTQIHQSFLMWCSRCADTSSTTWKTTALIFLMWCCWWCSYFNLLVNLAMEVNSVIIYHMVLHMVLPLQELHLYWLGIMTGASTTTPSCISIFCISTHWWQYESCSITHGLNMQPTLYPP